MDEELADLFDWHGTVDARLTWDEIELAMGTRLPLDFKRLMSRFPSGVFGERFYVYSPVQAQASFEEFREDWREDLDWLLELRDDEQRLLPYPVYPEPGGVIPWGTGDEHVFYWRTSVEGDDPDRWPVVYADRFAADWGEYAGDMSSFIRDVITGRFSDPKLYYEPSVDRYVFTPFERFL